MTMVALWYLKKPNLKLGLQVRLSASATLFEQGRRRE